MKVAYIIKTLQESNVRKLFFKLLTVGAMSMVFLEDLSLTLSTFVPMLIYYDFIIIHRFLQSVACILIVARFLPLNLSFSDNVLGISELILYSLYEDRPLGDITCISLFFLVNLSL